MAKRIIFGSILIAIIVLLLWMDHAMQASQFPRRCHGWENCQTLPGLPLACMLALLAWVGFGEIGRLSAAAGMGLLSASGRACTLVIATLPFWQQSLASWSHLRTLALLVAGLTLMLLFVHQVARYRTQEVIRRIGSTLLAVIYLGVGLALVLAIRIDFGLGAMVLYLLTVKATDMGAYFVGSAWGKHKLIPWLSPGKSWEGLAGGVAAAGALGAIFAAASGGWAVLGVLPATVFGLVLGVFGQGADLAESAMKRDAGIKDSGTSIPGFGGVLDVLDSLLLSSPVAYLLLAAMKG